MRCILGTKADEPRRSGLLLEYCHTCLNRVGTSVSPFHWSGRLPSRIAKNISWIALVTALEVRRTTEDEDIAANFVRPQAVRIPFIEMNSLAGGHSASLHHPILLESINHALTGFDISADVLFQFSFGKGPVKDLPFRLVWNDTDTVAIAKDQIARPDPNLVDCDRTAKIHYIVAALQTVGVKTVSEGGKVQR